MNKIKRFHSPSFKTQVALDLIKEVDSTSQICSKHGIHPTQAGKWKSQFLANMVSIFDNKPDYQIQEKEKLIGELYKQIGQLKVELDWLKKKTNSS